jgi:hypothetical protein
MGTKTSYSHSGNNCTKRERFSDGCGRTTVSDRSSGRVRSETKHKTKHHQNW